MMVKMPFTMSIRNIAEFPPNITMTRLQQIIENKVIPALDRSIDRLVAVEADSGTEITITDSEETYIIDLAEVYLFDAAVHAARAGFRIALGYNYDAVGQDGTYNWISDIREIDENDDYYWYCSDYEIHSGAGGDTLALIYESWSDKESDAKIESVLVSVAVHNLNRPAFMTLKNSGEDLGYAYNDMMKVISKLEACVNAVRNRPHPTEENVIKLADLTDMETDFNDGDMPNFIRNFTNVESMLDWLRGFISNPTPFTEEIGPRNTSYTWTMDMNQFFSSPIQDWKEMLPYHRWTLPTGNWIERSVEPTGMIFDNGGSPFEAWVRYDGICQYHTFYDIYFVRDDVRSFRFNSGDDYLEFLDGEDGSVIDLDVVKVPYFPNDDYTFNNIFPNMTRQKWIDLVDILE
jgi:hypothetical protein